jgi:hypothetical protein
MLLLQNSRGYVSSMLEVVVSNCFGVSYRASLPRFIALAYCKKSLIRLSKGNIQG